jgi:hypothetical protein
VGLLVLLLSQRPHVAKRWIKNPGSPGCPLQRGEKSGGSPLPRSSLDQTNATVIKRGVAHDMRAALRGRAPVLLPVYARSAPRFFVPEQLTV